MLNAIFNKEKSVASGSRYSTLQTIQAIFEAAHENRYAIAVWQMPGDDQIQLIADFSGELRQVTTDIDALESGFILAPFEQNSELPKGSFIKADVYFSFETDKKNNSFRTLTNDSQRAEEFLEHIDKKISDPSDHCPYFPSDVLNDSSTEKEHFISITQKAVELIRANEFRKVVPSRTKKINLDESFHLAGNFIKLCQAYPNAFISAFSVPELGTWMGATPEVLVSVDHQQQVFKTVALAGTQFVSKDITIKTAAWRQKEIEEQAMVSRYIINCFKKIRLREFEENGPKTVQAGNLLHLKTDFMVDMKETNFSELGTVMLNLLHPTSAVCGMPKENALKFLVHHEGYKRSFYSGFLGPVNINEQSHLFVNLRCMQLGEQEAVLYAGAGVTEDSDPEKEWIETEMKCNTLLNIIQEG